MTASPAATDWSLILPTPRRAAGEPITAMQHDQPVTLAQAIEKSRAMLRDATAPAIVGLGGLTLQGVRAAIDLAAQHHMKLLPDPWPAMLPCVSQAASFEHAMTCDLLIMVQNPACPNGLEPIARKLERPGRKVMRVAANLATVLTLREALDPTIAAATQAVVVLPARIDPRVLSQWHELAASVQTKVRLSVLQLPDLGRFGNARGVWETLAWMTGQACHRGGVDFADESPSPCESLEVMFRNGGVDLVLDTGLVAIDCDQPRIRIGPEPDDKAAISFITPGLALGLDAHVMRFDAAIFHLADQNNAVSDPVVELLAAIGV